MHAFVGDGKVHDSRLYDGKSKQWYDIVIGGRPISRCRAKVRATELVCSPSKFCAMCLRQSFDPHQHNAIMIEPGYIAITFRVSRGGNILGPKHSARQKRSRLGIM